MREIIAVLDIFILVKNFHPAKNAFFWYKTFKVGEEKKSFKTKYAGNAENLARRVIILKHQAFKEILSTTDKRRARNWSVEKEDFVECLGDSKKKTLDKQQGF